MFSIGLSPTPLNLWLKGRTGNTATAATGVQFSARKESGDSVELQLADLRRRLLDGNDSQEGAQVVSYLRQLFESKNVRDPHTGDHSRDVTFRKPYRGLHDSDGLAPEEAPRLILATKTYGPGKEDYLRVLLSLPGVELLPGALENPGEGHPTQDAFVLDTSKVPALASLSQKLFYGVFTYEDAHLGGW